MTDDALTTALERARELRRLPPPRQRRALRVRAGLTQPALAAVVKVSAGALSRWEAGLRMPRGDGLLRYLRALDRLAQEAPRR